MTFLRPTLSIGLVLGSIVACGSADPAKNAGSTDCDGLANKAREEVQKVMDSHLTCTKDEDCVTVAFATSCFDSCSRSVASTGVAKIDEAKDEQNKNTCVQFKDKGCKSIIPPCVPPQAPRCDGGRCV